MPLDLKQYFAAHPSYVLVDSDGDTTNLVCKYGHIYADGDYLVAVSDGWQDHPADQSACESRNRRLRSLGSVIMDGEYGELSVKIMPFRFRDAARVLCPKRSRKAKAAG